MNRQVEPEILDSLDPKDLRARRARADLQIINRLMGNHRIVASAANRLAPDRPFKRILEVGAGDGRFLARTLPFVRGCSKEAEIYLLDRCSSLDPNARKRLTEGGRRVRAIREEVFTWLKSAPELKFDLVFSNLFVHHFSNEGIRDLFHLLAGRTNCFVACEPRRSLFAMKASALFWILGFDRVTQHDGPISVRAGFAGNELSQCWPKGLDWATEEGKRGLFSHVFCAQRLHWVRLSDLGGDLAQSPETR